MSKPLLVTYLSLSTLFYAAYNLGLITGVYMGNIGFVYMIVLITLGLILIAHQITVYGRWCAVSSVGLLIVMTLLVFLFAP